MWNGEIVGDEMNSIGRNQWLLPHDYAHCGEMMSRDTGWLEKRAIEEEKLVWREMGIIYRRRRDRETDAKKGPMETNEK